MRLLPWIQRGLALAIVGAGLTLSGCERALVTEAASYQAARLGDEGEVILGEGVTRMGNTITISDSGRVLLTAVLQGEALSVTSAYINDGKPALIDVAEIQAMQELMLSSPHLQQAEDCFWKYWRIVMQVVALFACFVPIMCAFQVAAVIASITAFIIECGQHFQAPEAL